jgi:hypothetical protein
MVLQHTRTLQEVPDRDKKDLVVETRAFLAAQGVNMKTCRL